MTPQQQAAATVERLSAVANVKCPNQTTRRLRTRGVALAVAAGLTDDLEILQSASRYATCR
jgi:hypothetical protein